MNKVAIIDLEDAFSLLLGQIDYGDISNMDIYWDDLASAIKKLSFNEWKKPYPSEVADLLKMVPSSLVPDGLIDLVEEMMYATDKSSNDTFDVEQLKYLRNLSDEAEGLFGEMVENLREYKNE